MRQICSHVRNYTTNPNNPEAQKGLYLSARAATRPGAELISIGTKTVPTIADSRDSKALDEACARSTKALAALLEACNAVTDTMGGQQLNVALQELSQCLADLNTLLISAQ